MSGSTLDEAYERLRHTGPEFDGWLSNHAPMAAEVLVRRGRQAQVHRWLDGYVGRLDERPRGIRRIAPPEWRDPLGDPVRAGDWLDFFERELSGEPWREVLVRWWPRLLPGIAAGATHGVIRVGHAVHALLETETATRVAELGCGLAYWAARWQPLAVTRPGVAAYQGPDPVAALDRVPRVPDQRHGIRSRLAQLAGLSGWPGVRTQVAGDDDVEARLASIVDAAVVYHGTHGYANPVMLVHAATAPAAVLRALPALPRPLWAASLSAAWAAAAAVTAAYAPARGRPVVADPAARTAADVMSRAVATADPHAIKFADTAIDTYVRQGDVEALGRAVRSIDQIAAD
jgi:hypothetical protein